MIKFQNTLVLSALQQLVLQLMNTLDENYLKTQYKQYNKSNK